MAKMHEARIHTLTVAIRAVLYPDSVWPEVNFMYNRGWL